MLNYTSVIREVAATNGDAAQHGVTMTRHSENCASRILYLGKGKFQNLVSACTIHRSKQLFRNNFRPRFNDKYTPNFASTSKIVLNVDQTPAPTNMPVNPVEIQDIQELKPN